MSNHHQVIACLTGVRDPDALKRYEQWLADLGVTYKQSFLYQTDILIVASVFKEKYKIWRSFKKRIPCVRIDWIQDSHRQGRRLPTTDYELSTVFQKCQIGVCGYSEEQAAKIKQIIEELGGVAQVLGTEFSKNNKRINELKIDPNLEVLLTDKCFYEKMRLQCQRNINIPCVGLQWLTECRKKKICKYPLDYAFNIFQLKASKKERQLCRLKAQIHKKINEPFFATPIGTLRINAEEKEGDQTLLISKKNSEKNLALFRDCLIYLHPELIDPSLMAILKQLICIEEGMYVQILTPNLSHIVVDNLEEKAYADLLKYGDLCTIVRVDWLVDSILFGTKMQEEDYRIFYFKKFQNEYCGNSLSFSRQKDGKKLFMNSQDKSLSTLPHNPDVSGSFSRLLSDRPHISKSMNKTQVVKKKVQFKSNVLKGLYFYIPQKFRKDKEFKSLVTVIRENAGIAYEKPKPSLNMFCVMIDCPDMQTVCKEVCLGFQKNLQPISPRWIYYCVKKGNLVDFSAENYFIFKPFRFKVPLFCFMTMKIEIVGVNDVLKIRLRELVSELGSKRMKPSIHEITHCFCGDNLNEEGPQKRMKQIRKGNKKTKFVKLSWIFDYLNEGVSAPEMEKYQIILEEQEEKA